MWLKRVVKKHMRLKLIVIGIHDIKEFLRIFPCTLIIVKSENKEETVQRTKIMLAKFSRIVTYASFI